MYREDYRHLKSVNYIWASILFVREFARFDISHSVIELVDGQFVNLVALLAVSVALRTVYKARRLD